MDRYVQTSKLAGRQHVYSRNAANGLPHRQRKQAASKADSPCTRERQPLEQTGYHTDEVKAYTV